MLEALAIILIGVFAAGGVFVGLVVLFVFLALVMGAANWTLDKITSIGCTPYVPPESQIEEAYKDRIQRIRDTAAYGSPLFIKKKDEVR